MAKDIRECLLEQARKFHQWQEITYPGKNTEEIGGEWEVDYPAWNDIFDAFCHVLTQMDAETADSVLLDEMVYLIARDNEAEGVIQETTSHPQWFECLCRRAAASNENEAKWQFAAYLPECSCSQEVRDIILNFAKDPNEYVSRRALLAMPALRPDCVEQFAPLFWERNCYPPELQEYQRIAVLVSLDVIHSDLLPQYLERAKQDGRSYLLEHAKRIEGGLAMNEKLSRKKTAAARNNSKPSSAPMGKEQIAVAKSWLLSPEDFEVSVNGSFITAFPKEYTGECSVLQRYLRIVQAGVVLGEVKGKDLIPNHALAMSPLLLRTEAFASEEIGYEQAIAYLRKEAITLPATAPRGYVLLTYRKVPLGFVKNIGNRANNLYPQEWRIRSGYLPDEIRIL